MGRFFCGAFFGGAFVVYILGFTVLAVGGADDGFSGEVIIKGKLVSWRGWRPVGSTGQYNSRWRQSVGEGKSERVGKLSLIALCLLRWMPLGRV